MTVDRQLLKGSTATLVLSLLEREAMYGYQIIKEIEALSQGLFAFQEGTLYPILHTLEREGLVVSYWEDRDTGRKRKYYRITAEGIKALAGRRREWQRFRQAVDRITGGEVQPCQS
ncbi:MAG: PadR family transcriptional regulator [Clostridia bacterium]|nr:MAG: PadR family transcriptional regulator [Clostridia bacterium]